MIPTRRATLGAAAAMLTPLPAVAAPRRVTLYAHRGASALRPEHTEGAYLKAIEDGADFIEPDLVSTKDGVLVARHEPDIDETTDIAAHPQFAARRRTVQFDGRTVTGFFACDFTLAELKTLRARERLPKVRPESARYDGRWPVLTFQEVLDIAQAESRKRGRTIGVVPELKSSTWHAGQGHPIDEAFLKVATTHPHARRAPLHVQSFEIDNLKRVRSRLGRSEHLKLVQLVGAAAERPVDHPETSYAAMTSPAGLKAVAAYADVVAPALRSVIPLGEGGKLGQPNALIRDAHAAGLGVVVWTFRPENVFLPADLRGVEGVNARHEAGALEEMRRFIAAGVDGFFTDDPALGRRAIDGAAA